MVPGAAEDCGPFPKAFGDLSGEEKDPGYTVLLLDDVLSELDSSRQTYLLESIHDIQTLITCTGLDDFVSHQFKINRVFQVVKGHVYMPKGF